MITDTDRTIRQIEFELEKAEHGMGMPYDAERVGQLRSMLRERGTLHVRRDLQARRAHYRAAARPRRSSGQMIGGEAAGACHGRGDPRPSLHNPPNGSLARGAIKPNTSPMPVLHTAQLARQAGRRAGAKADGRYLRRPACGSG